MVNCWEGSNPSSDKAVEVALAEFDALRAEIVNRRSTQRGLIGVALAAYGAAFGFALGENPETRFLLVVPPLGFVLALLQVAESLHIHLLGQHIKNKVWCDLQARTGYRHSWEAEHTPSMRGGRIVMAVLSDGLVPLVLAGGAAFAAHLARDVHPLALTIGLAFAVATVAAVILLGVTIVVLSHRAAGVHRFMHMDGRTDSLQSSAPVTEGASTVPERH